MNYEKIIVIKRNGSQEPFALGRIALAVYKAACAHEPPLPASKARSLGASIAQQIHTLVREGPSGSNRIELEWIQDQVVAGLKGAAEEALAQTYQAYREAREMARSNSKTQKDKEKKWRFVEPSSRLEFTQTDWRGVLEKALERGPGREWDVDHWWDAAKDRASAAPNYAQFVGAHIEALLNHCDGRQHWMKAASALLIERWSKSALGVGFLSDSVELANEKLVCLAKPYLQQLVQERVCNTNPHASAYKADPGMEKANKDPAQRAELGLTQPDTVIQPWCPIDGELDSLIELLDLKTDAALGFQGLCLLEKTMPHFAGGIELPSITFARVSIALASHDRVSTNAAEKNLFMKEVFKALSKGHLLLPLSSLKSALQEDQSLIQEWALGVEDNLESIFDALKETAIAGKSGGSVAVDLSAIRAEGRGIGEGSRTSAGLRPVLALFGEACGMLEASAGERQKARLFLEPWHADLETFLAYGKIAPTEIKLGVALPDAFMKRVIEGGDWILCSSTEAPFLAKSNGAEFERWVGEYTQMAKLDGLGKARRVEARQVFDWICQSIQSTGGPAIAFKDQLEVFGGGASKTTLSTRMSSLLPVIAGEKSGAPEAAINASSIKSSEDGIALCRLALRALQSASDQECCREGTKMKWCQTYRPVALTVVGQITPQLFSSWALTAASELGQGVWESHALWSQEKPWNESRERLLKRRGGMLEPLKELDQEASLKSSPPFATLISMSAREEYLWLSDEAPSFLDGASYRAQARFGQGKAVFGAPRVAVSVKKQAQIAAAWQAHCDQGMTWDARVDRLSAKLIGEAIKLAWLQGLSGVRRFLGPTAGSID